MVLLEAVHVSSKPEKSRVELCLSEGVRFKNEIKSRNFKQRNSFVQAGGADLVDDIIERLDKLFQVGCLGAHEYASPYCQKSAGDVFSARPCQP